MVNVFFVLFGHIIRKEQGKMYLCKAKHTYQLYEKIIITRVLPAPFGRLRTRPRVLQSRTPKRTATARRATHNSRSVLLPLE